MFVASMCFIRILLHFLYLEGQVYFTFVRHSYCFIMFLNMYPLNNNLFIGFDRKCFFKSKWFTLSCPVVFSIFLYLSTDANQPRYFSCSLLLNWLSLFHIKCLSLLVQEGLLARQTHTHVEMMTIFVQLNHICIRSTATAAFYSTWESFLATSLKNFCLRNDSRDE